jgi:4-amino-4-deoxy-L-arabinose transferase-like glycosyltransferase
MRRGVPSPHCTSMVGTGATAPFMPAPLANASLDRQDLLCLGTLLLLWFCLLMLRHDSLPLQIWDESRLANSALEMVRSGHWLVPSYGGVPDHWSVKPPLLIWQMAALMWLGLPPLLAVRLPTMLAALATVGTVWAVCRYAVRDRVAAALAGFLLLSSLYYTDIHIARTGDYDVPLTLFTLLYALAFWVSIERDGKVRTSWFAISATALVIAVMTKGVAGAFPLVGLLVFSLMRGRLVMLLGSFRIWLLALLALVLCLGYYGSREQYDPGYLQAVWQNELGGRFFTVNEGNAAGRGFYVGGLICGFEPGVILLPFAALTILGTDTRRRSLVTLCLLCAATILAVLTISPTKIYWYATPILPFLAIAAALGVSDGLGWIKARELRLPKLFGARPLQVALGVMLAVVSVMSLYRNQVVQLGAGVYDVSQSPTPPAFAGAGSQPKPPQKETVHGIYPDELIKLAQRLKRYLRQSDAYWYLWGWRIAEQAWYGALFNELQARSNSSDVVVLDGGFEGAGENYNPVLKFYADIARTKGLRVKISALLPEVLPADELVATCDPKLTPWLKHRVGFSVGGQVHSCIFGAAHF